jgi:hypothetical protein
MNFGKKKFVEFIIYSGENLSKRFDVN